METAQRTLGWCPTVKENKLFFLSLVPLSSQPDELTKIKPGKDLGLFPGARSGGWLQETGRSAGKSKALQRQVALPSWCCCRSPHRCRAELCSPGPGSLPLASFCALCACYLLVTMWLLQFWPQIYSPGKKAGRRQSLFSFIKKIFLSYCCFAMLCLYCTAKWISYTYTYVPSFLDFLPICCCLVTKSSLALVRPRGL